MEGPIEGLMQREPPLDPTTYPFEPPLLTPARGRDCERCGAMVAICTGYGGAGGAFEGRRFVLHRGRAELDRGARARCWWCVRVARRLTRFETEPDGAGVPFLTTFEGGWSGARWITVSIQSQHEGLGFHVYGLRPGGNVPPSLGPATAAPSEETAIVVDTGTGGPAAWAYVAGRLGACVGGHAECRLGGDPWVPTRLIEVTAVGGETLHFRVVLTRDWKDKERYISVSHRWGGNKTPKLTSGTFDAYQRCIPVEVLPQKFVDAGKVAVRLGIKYLWIDSLDSVEDWEEESAQMHQVYRQGFCNLSAASADLNDDGLFYERDVAWRQPHVVHPPHQDQPLLVMDERDERLFQRLDEEPLYARSWVCQERLLSTRNISFTKDMIFFECARDLTCETSDLTRALLFDVLDSNDAQRLRSTMSYFTGFRFLPADAAASGNAAPPPLSMKTLGAHPAPHRHWQGIVEMYSGCRITVATDKLVALAGVARAFHEATGAAGYAAGLWAENLVEDLAWYALPYLPTWSAGGPPPDYVAPSWSWAAAWAVVAFWAAGAAPTHPLAAVRGLATAPHGRNALGRVRAGGNRLRLLCAVAPLAPVAPGWPALQQAVADLCRPGPSWMEFHGGFDRAGDEAGVPGCNNSYYFLAPLFYAHADPPPDDDSIPSDDVLPLLVLAPCTPAWGVYRRVGVVHVHVFHRAADGPRDPDPEAEGLGEDEEWPAVCQQARARGLRPELCRALGRVLQAAREADVPSLETDADGRRVITII